MKYIFGAVGVLLGGASAYAYAKSKNKVVHLVAGPPPVVAVPVPVAPTPALTKEQMEDILKQLGLAVPPTV